MVSTACDVASLQRPARNAVRPSTRWSRWLACRADVRAPPAATPHNGRSRPPGTETTRNVIVGSNDRQCLFSTGRMPWSWLKSQQVFNRRGDTEPSLFGANMARKCHRQKPWERFIFLFEQFWGRAARASQARKSLGTPVIFGAFLFCVLRRARALASHFLSLRQLTT